MSQRGRLIRRPVLAGSLGLLSALPAAAQRTAESRPAAESPPAEDAAESPPAEDDASTVPTPAPPERKSPADEAPDNPAIRTVEAPTGGDADADGPPNESDPPTPEPSSDTKATCIADHMQGQEARLDGSLAEAQHLFERCANPACPALVRADCQVWGVEILDALPKVVFRLGPNLDARDVHVSLDGAPFAVEYGVPTTFQPGSFQVRFEVQGHPPVIQQLELRAGDPRQTITVDFPTVTSSAQATPPEAVTPTEPKPPRSEQPEATIPAVSYAFGGLALAAASVGTYFAVDGLAKHNRANETCSPLCDEEQADAVRRQLLNADIAFGISFASAAAAVIVYLVDTPTEADAHSTDVWINVASERVGLGWGGAF